LLERKQDAPQLRRRHAVPRADERRKL